VTVAKDQHGVSGINQLSKEPFSLKFKGWEIKAKPFYKANNQRRFRDVVFYIHTSRILNV